MPTGDIDLAPSDPAHSILEPLSAVPTPVKALAWDTYQIKDQSTFEKRLAALPLPKEAKAKLWDAKYGTPAAAAPPPVAEKPGLLGDATKKASIGPAETLKQYGVRQGRALGKTLYNAIPLVTGTAGAAVAAAPFVAATPFTAGASDLAAPTAAVAGAGAGGLFGRRIQQYIDSLTGKAPLPSAAKAIGEMGQTAAGQMEQEMAGQLIAMPLGFVRRGGFVKMTPEVADTVAANRALGTRLSGPELASGTHIGEISKTIQAYSSGAFGGARIQEGARKAGSKAAFKVVDDALALIGHPGVASGPTANSKGLAAGARAQAGQLIESAVERAPAIDVKAVKDEAAKELEQGIVQHLKAVPDAANPGLAKLIRQVRADPALIQRLPRPAVTRLADAVLERFKSPSLQILRRVVGMEDSTAAKGVWEEVKSLGARSTPEDQLYAKGDAQRIATMFRGKLRDALGQAAPELSQALKQYRDLANGDFIRDSIVLGGKPMPTSEAAADDALTSMGDRLRKAVNDGTIQRRFQTPDGQQVIRHLTTIANLMEKRTKPMAGNLRKIFELGRFMTIGAGAVTGHLPASTATAATLWEGFPDFFTWVIHDPKATKWFVEGVKSPNPVTSSDAAVRLMEFYRQTHKGSGSAAPPQAPQ